MPAIGAMTKLSRNNSQGKGKGACVQAFFYISAVHRSFRVYRS
jgi:hypothetical protein